MTFTLTKNHLILTLISAVFFGLLGVAWWAAQYMWWFIGLAAIVLISSLAWWKIKVQDPELQKIKKQQKQDGQLVNNLFKALKRELKERGLARNKYRLPWYLYLTHDLAKDQAVLSQMGFRLSNKVNLTKRLPLQVWLKTDGLVIALEVSSDNLRNIQILKQFLTLVRKMRARQPLNGILLAQSVSRLSRNDRADSQQLASDMNLALEEAQIATGQRLPLYFLINQMAGLADFCQYFASLDEVDLDGSLGMLLEPELQSQGYRSAWLNEQLDKILKSMGDATLYALDSQLNEDFRRSVVAAPIQFSHLRSELQFYLEAVLQPQDNQNQYQFRGIFFTNTEQQEAATDLLTQQSAYDFSYDEKLVTANVKLPHSVFVSRLFNKFIRPEAGLASINKYNKRLFWFLQTSYLVTVGIMAFMVIATLKLSFDYHSEQNSQALTALKTYKAQIRKKPYDLENLVINIQNLTRLRAIWVDYEKDKPPLLFDFVPNPSIKKEIQQAYYGHLKTILLPTLVRYIEEELFVYETLGDSLETAKLLNLHSELVNHSQEEWLNLEQYFKASLKKEGYLDDNIANDLMALMDDLFNLGIPTVYVDQQLITQAKRSLKDIDQTSIIFNFIKQQKQFNHYVKFDLLAQDKFNVLFETSPSVSASIPYLFTPQGFAEFDLRKGSPLLNTILEGNKAIVGANLNEYELNNLRASLWRIYQKQYVSFWQNLSSNITLAKMSPHNYRAILLQLATTDGVKPFAYYQALSDFTRLPNQPLSANSNEQTQADAQPIEVEKNMMANRVNDEFNQYHQLALQGQAQFEQYGMLAQSLLSWLESETRDDRGQFYYNQLLTEADKSLMALAKKRFGFAPLEQQKNDLISLVENDAIVAIKGYLNQRWLALIYTPFEQYFATKFPFALDGQYQVSLNDFNRYLKPEGIFEQNQKHLLQGFSKSNGEYVLKGFTGQNAIVIKQSVLTDLAYFKHIQTDLYQADPTQASLRFKLKPYTLSAQSLSFSILAERGLFNYQHGPKLWHEFQWPLQEQGSELTMKFTDTTQKHLTTKYQGQWAWFAFLYQDQITRDNKHIIKLDLDKQQIQLEANAGSDNGVLDANYFARIKLPKALF